jgi:hypothetical protein
MKPEELAVTNATTTPTWYAIRVEGCLTAHWAEWFEGLTLTQENDQTVLSGPVVDQAALHGLLRKVRDLGLPLLSVNPLDPAAPSGADAAGDQDQKE